MFNETFVQEIGLWVGSFGDVKLMYDDITKDLCLRPKEIDNGIVLLSNLGIGKVYTFSVEEGSNLNTTGIFFLYRMLDSEVLLVCKRHKLLVFEERGQTLYKPEKVRYYRYGATEIYHIHPRGVYHIYHEGVKLILPNDDEIVISKANS
jgi:hypothetical protein